MELYDLHPPLLDFKKEVLAGLASRPKRLNPMYLYDEKGSELFEAITELEEYYPTRTEVGILKNQVEALDECLPAETTIVEFGSGSSMKIQKLLNVSTKIKQYIPIEISKEILTSSCQDLATRCPKLKIDAICADYTDPSYLDTLRKLAVHPITLFFPGSTIGNLDRSEAAKLLQLCAEIVGEAGCVVIGMDLFKEKEILEKAYDDSSGVTAEFNLNLIDRMNRQLNANFDKDTFGHKAEVSESLMRVEMHLESKIEQTVQVADEQVSFEKGETIHTESSHKYTDETIKRLFAEAGLTIELKLKDPKEYFSVVVAKQE